MIFFASSIRSNLVKPTVPKFDTDVVLTENRTPAEIPLCSSLHDFQGAFESRMLIAHSKPTTLSFLASYIRRLLSPLRLDHYSLANPKSNLPGSSLAVHFRLKIHELEDSSRLENPCSLIATPVYH